MCMGIITEACFALPRRLVDFPHILSTCLGRLKDVQVCFLWHVQRYLLDMLYCTPHRHGEVFPRQYPAMDETLAWLIVESPSLEGQSSE